MKSLKNITKALKDLSKNSDYDMGFRSVSQNIHNSKFVILSDSINVDDFSNLEKKCKENSIPVIKYDGNSSQLGKAFDKNFRITAVSIKQSEDLDLDKIITVLNS
ncbi:MAG: ribosomal L7Ae/L30e/S12e/Gadd45 family protein [Thermoproteota archaeon]|jgi:ribosomal protein L30E|tara:strand:- start:213 stop:527 length:315 start_codon:yes stop_codon:yes gene_type:complete